MSHAFSPHDAGKSAVGRWLLVLALMVFGMVILGGLTRLTGSGLSMVEWQPLSLLPPLSADAWRATFAAYQESPQYRLLNSDMTVDGFKAIYWLEYVHRLWGRIIGFAFLLPFLWFLWRRTLSLADLPRLLTLFVLGGVQGVIGWLMVKSGLADRPEVSQVRLMAHLSAALVIYAALLWSAFDYLRPAGLSIGPPAAAAARRLRRPLLGLLVLVCLTIPAGALVAGLHAGLIYNSYPLMGGHLVPPEAFADHPLWHNFYENLALVQFDHRVLAQTTWACAVVLWLWSRRLALPVPLHRAVAAIAVAATGQAALGISTLLLTVPLPLAALHQAGAFLLFSTVLWALHSARRMSALNARLGAGHSDPAHLTELQSGGVQSGKFLPG